MHIPATLFITLVLAAILTSGCSNGMWTRGDTGAVVGSVAGAAVGQQIGGGSGRAMATVAGSVIGSILGRRLGNRMTPSDRNHFGRTLTDNRAGQTGHWTNDTTHSSYAVTPTGPAQSSGDQPCRPFRMRADIDGQPDHVNGTACRQADGSWVIQ